MRKIGSYMVFFGLFAIVLNFIDRVPTLLMWIYSWGDTTAWIIKIGLIVVGAVLFIMGGQPEPEAGTEIGNPSEDTPVKPEE